MLFTLSFLLHATEKFSSLPSALLEVVGKKIFRPPLPFEVMAAISVERPDQAVGFFWFPGNSCQDRRLTARYSQWPQGRGRPIWVSNAVMEDAMLNIMYDLPSIDDVKECVVGEDVVLNKEDPILLYEQTKKQA